MRSSISYFLLSSIFSLASAQQQPDGVIVPFTSVLPVCASTCGALFDVQGACAPPVLAAPSESCFCGDARLKPIAQTGTAGVTSVCKGSCTSTADMEAVQSWYDTYCKASDSTTPASTTTAASAGSTGTGTSSSTTSPKAPVPQTWLQGHWKYIVMLVIMVVAIVGGWVGAIYLRRSYIRKKEREIEMRPPVAWGPHQMQGATGGYNYQEGVINKEASGMESPAGPTDKLENAKPGWLRKHRN